MASYLHTIKLCAIVFDNKDVSFVNVNMQNEEISFKEKFNQSIGFSILECLNWIIHCLSYLGQRLIFAFVSFIKGLNFIF